MPALAVARYHPDLRATYRQLVAEGQPRKVAVVVVRRTRLVLANARIDPDRCWRPERPGRPPVTALVSSPVPAVP